jgi:hypothetical protein
VHHHLINKTTNLMQLGAIVFIIPWNKQQKPAMHNNTHSCHTIPHQPGNQIPLQQNTETQ